MKPHTHKDVIISMLSAVEEKDGGVSQSGGGRHQDKGTVSGPTGWGGVGQRGLNLSLLSMDWITSFPKFTD